MGFFDPQIGIDTYLGLITPKTAATSNTQKFPTRANTTPEIAIEKEARSRMARRPTLSAKIVRMKVRPVFPISVRVMNSPILVFEMSNADKNVTRMSVVLP